MSAVHALQDAIKVDGKPGKFEVPNWDPASRKKVRDALLVLATTVPDANGLRHQGRGGSGAAPARGGVRLGRPAGEGDDLPERHPEKNDGKTIYRLTVKDVPVDGFWSVSVYNAEGYFETNAEAPTRSTTSRPRSGSDGAVTIQFGGCDGARSPTACRSRRAGTTPCACTSRGRRFSTAHGSSRSRRPDLGQPLLCDGWPRRCYQRPLQHGDRQI